MQPILFKFDSIVVSSFALLSSLSFFIASFIFIINGLKRNLPLNKILGLVVCVNISGIVGSRLLFVLNNFSQFGDDPWLIFSISSGGYAFYGGFLFAFLSSVLYLKINQLPFGEILDIGSPSLAVGMIINKFGCFMAGCCYGKETTLAVGVQFPKISIPTLSYGFPHSIHPSQIYASVFGLLILIVLLWSNKYKRFSGQVFLSFVILFSLERMLNLTQRGDIYNDILLGFPQSQFLGFVFMLLAFIVWVILSTRKKITLKSMN